VSRYEFTHYLMQIFVQNQAYVYRNNTLENLMQPEPEFRPPMSEVVEALVRLVQRANMTKRMLDGDNSSRRGDDQDQDFI
jgi:hypothetical protein